MYLPAVFQMKCLVSRTYKGLKKIYNPKNLKIMANKGINDLSIQFSTKQKRQKRNGNINGQETLL